MKIKKHLKEIIITLSVISLTAVGYAAVTGVTTGDSLTATIWNEMKAIVDSNEVKLTNISNDGANVGIGHLTTNERLMVNGSINSNNQSNSFSDGGVRVFMDLINTSKIGRIGTLTGGDSLSGEEGELGFFVNGSEKVRIDSTGNVGIGTTNPQIPLHVMGTNDAPSQVSVPNGSLIIGSQATGVQMSFGVTADISPQYAWIQPRYTNNSNNYNLVLNPNGGNVGIGETNPTTKLDVNGEVKATSFDIGYERIQTTAAIADSAGRYYAYCTGSKMVLGGSCTNSSGTVAANTQSSSNRYACYKVNTTSSLTVAAICGNVN